MSKSYRRTAVSLIALSIACLIALIPGRFVTADEEPTPMGTPKIPTQIYVNPYEGNRGTTISIIGSAFDASKPISLYFSSDAGSTASSIDTQINAYKRLGNVITSSSGLIDNVNASQGNQAIYQVPATLEDGSIKKNVTGGTYYIYAVYYNTKKVVAFTKFTVTSAATTHITPAAGFVGDRVDISASGLSAGEKITVKYDDRNTAIVSNNTTTDSSGNFLGSIIVPESTFGNHVITVTDATGNAPEGNFSADTRITLNPTVQDVGGDITVNGTGFHARKPVTVSVNGNAVPIKESPLSTTQYGSFQATVTLPFDFGYVSGAKIIIGGSDGASGATAELTIPATKPTLTLTPPSDVKAPGYVGMPVKMSGMWFSAGGKATITVDNGTVPLAVPAINENGAFFSEFNLPPAKSGQHNLTVSDGNKSATASFIIENTPPPVPAPDPATGANASGKAPGLSWKAVSDPSGLTYDLQVSADPGFGSLLIEKKGLKSTEYVLTSDEVSVLSRGGSATYWRMRAVDGASNASEWTAPSTITAEASGSGFILPPWSLYAAAGFGGIILISVILYLRKRAPIG